MRHHLYLSPGLFGFGRLASYDYFTHVERALTARIRARGEEGVSGCAARSSLPLPRVATGRWLAYTEDCRVSHGGG